MNVLEHKTFLLSDVVRLLGNLDQLNQLQPVNSSKKDGLASEIKSSTITLAVADFKNDGGGYDDASVVFAALEEEELADTQEHRDKRAEQIIHKASTFRHADIKTTTLPTSQEGTSDDGTPPATSADGGTRHRRRKSIKASIDLPVSALKQASCLHSHSTDLLCPHRIMFALHEGNELFQVRAFSVISCTCT